MLFDRDKNTKISAKTGSSAESGSEKAARPASQSVIAANLVVNGAIERSDRIRIDGRVTGDIAATSEIVVGKGGRVEGSLSAPRIVIGGTVNGDPKADEKLILEETAKLRGDATAPVMVFESGASARGEFRSGNFCKPVHSRGAWHSIRGRRSENQDEALIQELPGGRLLVAVADGMGGHRAGGSASKRALASLRASIEAGSDLADAVRAANATVFREGSSEPDLAGMGTTLVALLADRDEYLVANVGDSRAYRIDSDGIRQITVDHSFAAEALASDALSEEELEDSPWRNALMRAIGTEAEVDVDLFGPFSARPPHRVLLCTDGLHGALSDARILEALRGSDDDIEPIPQEVCELAYEAGATDNITAAVASVGRSSSTSGPRKGSSIPGRRGFQQANDGVTETSDGAVARSRNRTRGPSSSGGRFRGREVVRSQQGPWLSRKNKAKLVVVGVTLVLAVLAGFTILSLL